MDVISALDEVESPIEALRELFGNFADACEKTHRPNLARLLRVLARSCAIQAKREREQDAAGRGVSEELQHLADQLKEQRTKTYADGIRRAEEVGERGVLRAFTWGQKAAGIQASFINKILKSGAGLLDDGARVHVCEACGFVIVKDDAPDMCPVCKAPPEQFVSF